MSLTPSHVSLWCPSALSPACLGPLCQWVRCEGAVQPGGQDTGWYPGLRGCFLPPSWVSPGRRWAQVCPRPSVGSVVPAAGWWP